MKGFIIKSSTWGNQTHKVGLPEGCTIPLSFPVGGERYGVRPDIPTKVSIGVGTEETSM